MTDVTLVELPYSSTTSVTSRFRIRAAALTTFTPARDEDDRTLRAGLRSVDLLGEYASGS